MGMVFLALVLLLALQDPDHSAEGIKALEARNYEAAISHFSSAVKADPEDYAARFNLALAYSFSGKDAEAITEYKKVLGLKPGLYQALVNLGTVLLRQNKPAEAVPFLQAAVDAKPAEARPHLLLGEALFSLGRFTQAGQEYYAALTAEPQSAPAELGYARALVRQNQLAQAEPHFRRAIDLDPELRDSLLELAEAHEKTGAAENAIAILEQFPDNPGARERLGYLLMNAGRPKDAIPHLEWAAQKSPTAANRLALARAFRLNNEIEKSLATVAAAVEAEPANIDLRMAYGRELRDARRFSDAAQQFYIVTKAQPENVQAWNEFSAMLVSLEQFGPAIAALDRIKELGGETAGHVYLRAIVLDRVHDLKGAAAAYERYLQMSQGLNPNEEFKAKQRLRIIKRELEKR